MKKALKNIAEIEGAFGKTEKAVILYKTMVNQLFKSKEDNYTLCQTAINYSNLLRFKEEYEEGIRMLNIAEPYLDEVSWGDEAYFVYIKD